MFGLLYIKSEFYFLSSQIKKRERSCRKVPLIPQQQHFLIQLSDPPGYTKPPPHGVRTCKFKQQPVSLNRK